MIPCGGGEGVGGKRGPYRVCGHTEAISRAQFLWYLPTSQSESQKLEVRYPKCAAYSDDLLRFTHPSVERVFHCSEGIPLASAG